MSIDPRRGLEEAGRRPVPAPDPAFADRLEARLLAVAQTATPPPGAGGPRRPAKARRWLLLGGATLAALVVAVTLLGRPGDVTTPELVEAVNVKVVLRDGSVLEHPDGQHLPEGAVVTVGEGGFARIGTTILRPGDIGTIEEGRLEVEHRQPVGEVPTGPSPRPRPTPTRTPAPERTDPERTPKTPSTPRPTSKATAAPNRTPRPTATPAPRTTPTPSPSAAPTAAPTPSPTAPPPILTARPRLRAHANLAGDRVLVRWTATRRAASYLLIVTRSRVGAAPDPVYPGARLFRQFDSAPERWVRFRVLDPVVEVRVMVVALGRHGHEVSRSRIAIVATGGDLAGEAPPDPDPPPDDGGDAPPGDGG